MVSFSDAFRTFRRRLKSKLPYVRRREYRKLQKKYEAVLAELSWRADPAISHPLHVRKACGADFTGEVCFFVSFAPHARLKPHVVHHLRHLLRAGIKVALVVNTDLPPDAFSIDPELERELSGVYFRPNAGYDFAAWSQLYVALPDKSGWERLFLVNDSIVGPLRQDDFDTVIARVRASTAALVGLTENNEPCPHLQSYFLALQGEALRHPEVEALWRKTLCFADKTMVIDTYETRLTPRLRALGLRCEALIADSGVLGREAGDPYLAWNALLGMGFPYIKTSVIKALPEDETIRRLVPEEFRSGDF